MNYLPALKSGTIANSSKGFTIVETLVAITILMIAIAGPLVVASKGLTSAMYSKDQMIATFLAQESMELIKHGRDNGIQGSSDWLSVDGHNLIVECTQSDPCDASFAVVPVSDPLSMAPIVLCPTTCQLYEFTNDKGWYTNDSTLPSSDVTVSKFSRHFYVEDLGGDPDEARVHVIVDWMEGTIPYQVELVSQFVDVIR